MPSFLSIDLDTTGPSLAWVSVQRAIDGLAVHYSLDEPQVLSAKFVDHIGIEHPMVVLPDRIIWYTDSAHTVEGEVQVVARDEVLNESEHSLIIRVLDGVFGPRGRILKPLTGRVLDQRSGLTVSPSPGNVESGNQ